MKFRKICFFLPSAHRDGAELSALECIDALPTFVETAGSAPGPAIQGRSLLPLIRGEEPEGWRTEVYGDWDFRCYRISDALRLDLAQHRQQL